MTKHILITLILCLLLAGMASANGIGGDTYPAIIGIGEGSGTVTMPITVTNGSNVGSTDITITFDPAIVTVTCVADGDMDSTVPNTEFVGDGWVRIGTFQMGSPGLTEEFVLAHVSFKSVSSSGSCPIEITVKTFKDATPTGNPMAYEVSNGTYTATSDGNGDDNGGWYDDGDDNGDDGNVTPTVTPTTTPTTTPTASPTKTLPDDDSCDADTGMFWIYAGIGIAAILVLLYLLAKKRDD